MRRALASAFPQPQRASRGTQAQGATAYLSTVIAGLDPAIHEMVRQGRTYVRLPEPTLVMDAWVMPGHDKERVGRVGRPKWRKPRAHRMSLETAPAAAPSIAVLGRARPRASGFYEHERARHARRAFATSIKPGACCRPAIPPLHGFPFLRIFIQI